MNPQKSFKKQYIIAAVLLLMVGISIGGYLVLGSSFSFASIAEQLNNILEENKKPVIGCQPNPNDKNKDSDKDGLADWLEVTWKTDPCKPDTDSDGYLDGEEVSSGYNPTIPAPDDEINKEGGTKPRTLPNNLTQALAQILGEKMIEGELGLISDALDPASITTSNKVVNSAIQEILNKAKKEFSLPNISNEEIVILNNNSIAAVQFYAGNVVKIIDQWAEKSGIDQEGLFESEAQVFYYAIQTKDFNEVNKNIEFYRGVSESMKQIPVPSDLAGIHKEQIGIFWMMGNVFKAVKEIDSDPLRANLALEQYEVIFGLLDQTLQKLANYIRTHP